LARGKPSRGAVLQGIKPATVESRGITIAANKYVEDHPEMIAFATEQYWDFVKRHIETREKAKRQANE
jgi:hypothetical protein